MAIGLASFAEGALKGYATVKGIKRQEALDKRDEERDERERQRFALEQTRAQREEAQAKSAEEAKQEAIQVMEDQKFGRGAFAKFADPAKVQAVQQATQSVEQKGSRSYDQAEMQRLGVRPSPEAQSNSVTPQEENLFKSGGEGLYADQQAADNLKYELIGAAMKKSLINKGDFGAAMVVDRDIKKMKEEGYDFQRKKAAALVVAGAPPEQVINALDKVYEFVDDGKYLDKKNTTYDPKTRAYTLSVVDRKTGAVESRPMDQVAMLTALKLIDPVKVVEMNIAAKDKEEQIKREDDRFKVTTGLEERKIGIMQTEANAKMQRYASLTKLERDAAKGADQKAKVEAMIKLFPVPDMAPEKMLGKTPEEKELMRLEGVRNADLFEKTSQLVGLNPRVDLQTLANASRLITSGQLQAFRDNKGTYTKIGDTRVALP